MTPYKSTPVAIKELTKVELDYLLSALVWVPDLFSVAKDKLLPEYFDRQGEGHYAVLWRSILKLAAANEGRLPLEGISDLIRVSVLADAENEVKGTQVYNDLIAENNAFHLMVSYYNKTNVNRATAADFLSRFLSERRVMRRLANLAASGHTSELRDRLSDLYSDVSRFSSIGAAEVVSAVHVRSDKPGLQLQPTGISYFDERLGGGVSAGKVYGLLGPTGVGKTLNLVALMVSSAVQEQIRHRMALEAGIPSKLRNYYYLVYEGSKEDIIRRSIANLALIPLDRVLRYEHDKSFQLAGPSDPFPDYQLRVFPEGVGPDGELLLSEIERYSNANTVLSQNCFIREMVPSPENPRRGCGYVQEIQNVLLAEQEAGREVAGYYIDYAKIAAKNACGTKLDHLRHLVGGMPMECVKYINSYLPHAHGWIANQFNTEANKRSPTWVPHHSYASEAGDFGDNCWFTFCLGTRSQDDNCCLINCSKHRDFQPTPPSTLYIHGAFNRMVCMDNLIDLDSSTGQFVHQAAFDRDHRGMMVVPFRKKSFGDKYAS
jgi:hypothetical protein